MAHLRCIVTSTWNLYGPPERPGHWEIEKVWRGLRLTLCQDVCVPAIVVDHRLQAQLTCPGVTSYKVRASLAIVHAGHHDEEHRFSTQAACKASQTTSEPSVVISVCC